MPLHTTQAKATYLVGRSGDTLDIARNGGETAVITGPTVRTAPESSVNNPFGLRKNTVSSGPANFQMQQARLLFDGVSERLSFDETISSVTVYSSVVTLGNGTGRSVVVQARATTPGTVDVTQPIVNASDISGMTLLGSAAVASSSSFWEIDVSSHASGSGEVAFFLTTEGTVDGTDPSTINVLTNPIFAVSTTGWQTLSAARTTDEAQTGVASLRISPEGYARNNNFHTSSNNHSILPGTATVKFFVKRDATFDGTVTGTLRCTSSSITGSGTTYHTTSATITPTTSWTEFTIDLDLTVDNVNSKYLQFEITRTGSTTGDLYLDNVRLTESSSGFSVNGVNGPNSSSTTLRCTTTGSADVSHLRTLASTDWGVSSTSNVSISGLGFSQTFNRTGWSETLNTYVFDEDVILPGSTPPATVSWSPRMPEPLAAANPRLVTSIEGESEGNRVEVAINYSETGYRLVGHVGATEVFDLPYDYRIHHAFRIRRVGNTFAIDYSPNYGLWINLHTTGTLGWITNRFNVRHEYNVDVTSGSVAEIWYYNVAIGFPKAIIYEWNFNTSFAPNNTPVPSTGWLNTQSLGHHSLNTELYDKNAMRVGNLSGSTSLADAITNGSYITCRFMIPAGRFMDVDRLFIRVSRGGASEPRGFGVAFSNDGYQTVIDQPVTSVVPDTETFEIDVSSIATGMSGYVTMRIYTYAPTTGALLDFLNIVAVGTEAARFQGAEAQFRLWKPSGSSKSQISLRDLAKRSLIAKEWSVEDSPIDESNYIILNAGSGPPTLSTWSSNGVRRGYAINAGARNGGYNAGFLWVGSTDRVAQVGDILTLPIAGSSDLWWSVVFGGSATQWYEVRIANDALASTNPYILSIIHATDSGATQTVLGSVSMNGRTQGSFMDIFWGATDIIAVSRGRALISVPTPGSGPTSGWIGTRHESGKYFYGTGLNLIWIDIVGQIPAGMTAPHIGTVTGTDTTLTVNFTPPSDFGGSPLTNYQYSTNGGATWINRSPVSTESPLVISGLSAGTTYNLRLRGVNSFGPGAFASRTVSTTTSAPTVSATGGSGSITASWGAVAGATSYKYSINSGSTWTSTSNTSVTITNLNSNTTYTVQVRGVNAAGDGAIGSNTATTNVNKFTGGSISTSGSYRVHRFTSSGTLTKVVPGSVSVEVLIVAGGGATWDGFFRTHYGAGGGGVRSLSTSVSSTSTTITVGAVATNSSFGSTSATRGGGARSTWSTLYPQSQTDCNAKNGNSGGSGGGGVASGGSGGSGTSGQGNSGGNGAGAAGTYTVSFDMGSCSGRAARFGGGGGAGASGSNATTSAHGAGGAGLLSSISGSSVRYGAGEGGGDSTSGSPSKASNGTGYGVSSTGSANGNGVVIVRYLI